MAALEAAIAVFGRGGAGGDDEGKRLDEQVQAPGRGSGACGAQAPPAYGRIRIRAGFIPGGIVLGQVE
ncbi:MAG: hypothetical protein ABS75_26185 [Pelagibacterium sp. SCN 63-23]|nr:MAG: hypothetical protein ABS75_26185 [Pelagibacterium sp. SCN 63-23]